MYRLLHDHHFAYNRVYGKFKVTVNYHMALHLPEVILDYGPPHAFWCFTYERMNGILASTPTNNRGIENEVLNRFLLEFTFNQTQLPCVSVCQPELIHPEVHSNLLYTRRSGGHCPCSMLNQTRDLKCNKWLIKKVLTNQNGQWHPKKLNVLMDREFLSVLKETIDMLYASNVSPRINKYGRCSVNGQTFSSNFNSTDRGSIVKALFTLTDKSLHPYFGVVNFF